MVCKYILLSLYIGTWTYLIENVVKSDFIKDNDCQNVTQNPNQTGNGEKNAFNPKNCICSLAIIAWGWIRAKF